MRTTKVTKLTKICSILCVLRVLGGSHEFLIVNFLVVVLAVFSWATHAQSPPDGPGKDVFESVCSLCHDAPAAVMGKQWTKPQWEAKVAEMLQEETDVTAPERAAIVEYLSANFKPGGKIYINYAAVKDLETALELSSKDAEVIVHYREANGSFKTLADLQKVPDLDVAKIEAKKERVVFDAKN